MIYYEELGREVLYFRRMNNWDILSVGRRKKRLFGHIDAWELDRRIVVVRIISLVEFARRDLGFFFFFWTWMKRDTYER